MKTNLFYFLTLLVMTFGLASCSQDDILEETNDITEQIDNDTIKTVTITYTILSGGYPTTLPVRCDVWAYYEHLQYMDGVYYLNSFSVDEVYQQPITFEAPKGTELSFRYTVSMLQVGGFYSWVYEGGGVTYLIKIDIEGKDPIEYYGPNPYGYLETTITI